ncbi:MAG: hypothetical protein ACKO2G_12250 [Verrucomicrobiales bacterium]
MKFPDYVEIRHQDGPPLFQFSAFQFFQNPLPPATPFSPPNGPPQTLLQWLPAKSKFLAAKEKIEFQQFQESSELPPFVFRM